jgi:hypothetical protein
MKISRQKEAGAKPGRNTSKNRIDIHVIGVPEEEE